MALHRNKELDELLVKPELWKFNTAEAARILGKARSGVGESVRLRMKKGLIKVQVRLKDEQRGNSR